MPHTAPTPAPLLSMQEHEHGGSQMLQLTLTDRHGRKAALLVLNNPPELYQRWKQEAAQHCGGWGRPTCVLQRHCLHCPLWEVEHTWQLLHIAVHPLAGRVCCGPHTWS